MERVLQYVEENDISFVRLAFCDGAGAMHNLCITPSRLAEALARGVQVDLSPIFPSRNPKLIPDPDSLVLLPWRPSHGKVCRMFCALVEDDKPIAEDARSALKALDKPQSHTVEISFYLFDSEDNPADCGGYMDISPLDRGENFRRELCVALGEMHIETLLSYHGRGKGQSVIVLGATSPLNAADNIVNFRAAVHAIAMRNGLTASFAQNPRMELPPNHLIVSQNSLPSDCNPYHELRLIAARDQN